MVRGMGKRSRNIRARREKLLLFEHLGSYERLMNALKLDFCVKAAAFADSHRYQDFESPSAIAFLITIFQMREADAIRCISLGRYVAAADARRDAQRRCMQSPTSLVQQQARGPN